MSHFRRAKTPVCPTPTVFFGRKPSTGAKVNLVEHVEFETQPIPSDARLVILRCFLQDPLSQDSRGTRPNQPSTLFRGVPKRSILRSSWPRRSDDTPTLGCKSIPISDKDTFCCACAIRKVRFQSASNNGERCKCGAQGLGTPC